MSYPRKETISLTGSSSGGVTQYSSVITGFVRDVLYVANTLSTGTSITVTTEDTSQTVVAKAVAASAAFAPRLVTHTQAGASLSDLEDLISAVNERIQVVVTAGSTLGGGSDTTGTLTVIYG